MFTFITLIHQELSVQTLKNDAMKNSAHLWDNMYYKYTNLVVSLKTNKYRFYPIIFIVVALFHDIHIGPR